MTDNSPNLDLHYLLASQAQKHVTFNELINKIDALLMLSVNSHTLDVPPSNPTEGNSYIVPPSATGVWQNQISKIAIWQNLGWSFISPNNGFLAFSKQDGELYLYNNGWNKLSNVIEQQTQISSLSQLAVGTAPSATNPLSVKANSVLFSAKYSSDSGDGNLRIKINKELDSNIASFIFQKNWSGFAEFGLLGDNYFGIKTSSDGSNWINPFKIDAEGKISFITLNATDLGNISGDIIKKNNTRFLSTPKATNTDGNNLFLGLNAGSSSLAYASSTIDASYNIGIGLSSLYSITSGNRNIGIGASALYNNSTGAHNICIGHAAMVSNTNGAGNAAIGSSALSNNQSGSNNFGLGISSLYNNISGSNNVGIGATAMLSNTTGTANIGIGMSALYYNTSGSYNTALGAVALRYKTDGTNNDSFSYCTGIGYDSRVSGSYQLQLGGPGINTYCYGAVQDRSDMRDKTDVRDTLLGLNFINALRPVDFRWDMRDDYFVEDNKQDDEGHLTTILTPIPKDGSKKRNRYHHGLIAQDVKNVMNELGLDFGGFQDHKINGGADILSIGYTEIIAPLIKAVQELSIEIESIKRDLK